MSILPFLPLLACGALLFGQSPDLVKAGQSTFLQQCAFCHGRDTGGRSPTGDLAGTATRNNGLKLYQRLMYPGGTKAKMTVTLASGETVTGTRAYYDAFTVALRDAAGRYRSWPAAKVKVTVDDPAEAHVDLLAPAVKWSHELGPNGSGAGDARGNPALPE